jgi:hypothetical protein
METNLDHNDGKKRPTIHQFLVLNTLDLAYNAETYKIGITTGPSFKGSPMFRELRYWQVRERLGMGKNNLSNFSELAESRRRSQRLANSLVKKVQPQRFICEGEPLNNLKHL